MLSMSRKGNIFRGREDTPVLSFIKYILFLILIAVCFFGCGSQGRKKASCIVVLEDCEDAVPDRKSAEADRGNDISFTLT